MSNLLSIAHSTPVVMAKCCHSIIGCEVCVNAWFSGPEALTKSCPRCSSERGYNETMRLMGLDHLLLHGNQRPIYWLKLLCFRGLNFCIRTLECVWCTPAHLICSSNLYVFIRLDHEKLNLAGTLWWGRGGICIRIWKCLQMRTKFPCTFLYKWLALFVGSCC